MERPKQQIIDEQTRVLWHYDTNTRLSRLALFMAEEFIPGHDAQQTPAYEDARAEMLKLGCIQAEHDRATQPAPFTHLRG